MVESVHGVGDFLEELKHETFEKYDDISTIDQYQVALEAGCSEEEALQCCYENSRDNARTPMQWSDETNAGFTTGTPWLKVNPKYTAINVVAQEHDEEYRKEITYEYGRKKQLRRGHRKEAAAPSEEHCRPRAGSAL